MFSGRRRSCCPNVVTRRGGSQWAACAGVDCAAGDTHTLLFSFSIPSELLSERSTGERMDDSVRALVARVELRAAAEGQAWATAGGVKRGEVRWTAVRADVEVRAPYAVAL